MPGWEILIGIVILLVVLGLFETLRHRRTLNQVPVRIHVNGTRGKSSVTRLIAAGLRAGGIVTCAKTTGTLPRFILPDGRELPVFRPSRPNVIEQIRIVAAAAAARAEVLVLECMALQPNLQWLSENRLVRATHGVITNARADHLDVMGPDEENVAQALAGMMPHKGRFYTADARHWESFAQAARDRDSESVLIDDGEIATVIDAEMARFTYHEHAVNVALALRVCADLGVERHVALRGMWGARPDAGAMTEHVIDFFGRTLVFVNGFAANDPESTNQIWSMAIDRYPDVDTRIALVNCRADRADRSHQLGRGCRDWIPPSRIVLMGTGTYLFARAAAKAGVNPDQLIFAEDTRIDEIFETVVALCGRRALIMGMGNIGGQGLEVVRYFRNRETPCTVVGESP